MRSLSVFHIARKNNKVTQFESEEENLFLWLATDRKKQGIPKLVELTTEWLLI